MCAKETKWKSNKAKSTETGFQLYYHGVDWKINGISLILKKEYAKNPVKVKRASDRVMSLNVEIEGVMMNVGGYAPEVGCEMEEK